MLLKSLNIEGFMTKNAPKKARTKTYKAVKPCKQYNTDISKDTKVAAEGIINT